LNDGLQFYINPSTFDTANRQQAACDTITYNDATVICDHMVTFGFPYEKC